MSVAGDLRTNSASAAQRMQNRRCGQINESATIRSFGFREGDVSQEEFLNVPERRGTRPIRAVSEYAVIQAQSAVLMG